MGPKKAEKVVPVIEGYNQEEMTREQVEALCFRLQEEMKKEREDRAFFQLERDKVRSFWDVARLQLEEVLLQIRNKEHGREVADTERRKVLKFHDSNVKFLQNEFDKEVETLKDERKVMLKKSKDAFHIESMRLRKEKRELLDKLNESQEEQQKKEDKLKMHQQEIMDKRKEDGKEELAQLNEHFEKHQAELRESVALKKRVEMAEAEERHKTQLDILRRNHATAMSQIKHNCNEANLNNLSLIASLEATRIEAGEGHLRAMQEARSLRAVNRKLVGPLRDARDNLADMRRRMTNYHKDKKALARANVRANRAATAEDDLRREMNALEVEINEMRLERKRLTQQLKAVQKDLLGKEMQPTHSCHPAGNSRSELQITLPQRDA